jgi:hypothetical protein
MAGKISVMTADIGRLPDGTGLPMNGAEQVVSALRVGIPDANIFTRAVNLIANYGGPEAAADQVERDWIDLLRQPGAGKRTVSAAVALLAVEGLIVPHAHISHYRTSFWRLFEEAMAAIREKNGPLDLSHFPLSDSDRQAGLEALVFALDDAGLSFGAAYISEATRMGTTISLTYSNSQFNRMLSAAQGMEAGTAKTGTG